MTEEEKKAAKSEYDRQYRIKNKERIQIQDKIYYENNKEVYAERTKKDRKDNPEKFKIRGQKHRQDRMPYYKDYYLRKNYGITLKEYELLYDDQKGECFICHDYQEVLHVDHCHSTNVIRGLLCNSCNLALGLFKDNKENFIRAISYLNRETGYIKNV